MSGDPRDPDAVWMTLGALPCQRLPSDQKGKEVLVAGAREREAATLEGPARVGEGAFLAVGTSSAHLTPKPVSLGGGIK